MTISHEQLALIARLRNSLGLSDTAFAAGIGRRGLRAIEDATAEQAEEIIRAMRAQLRLRRPG